MAPFVDGWCMVYIYAESIGIITGKIKEEAEFGKEIKYEQCEMCGNEKIRYSNKIK